MLTSLLSPSPESTLPLPIRPAALAPLLANIPADIRDLPQWVCWRYSPVPAGAGHRWAKLPICPVTRRAARPNDPSTWATYDKALSVYNSSGQSTDYDGIGFMFSSDDPFVGVDLDHCRDPESGNLAPWALNHIRLLDTYTEVSPSGTGVKCILKGTLPPGRRRNAQVEIYDSTRYFTITGQVVHKLYNISCRPTELLELHRAVFPETSSKESLPSVSSGFSATDSHLRPHHVSDSEILRRAHQARNGQKFRRLWNGDTSGTQGDHSAADIALCRLLAFWCGPCRDLIDHLFRKSRLYRPKWDQVHFSDGRSYGQATIDKAIEDQNNTFFRWPSPNRRVA